MARRRAQADADSSIAITTSPRSAPCLMIPQFQLRLNPKIRIGPHGADRDEVLRDWRENHAAQAVRLLAAWALQSGRRFKRAEPRGFADEILYTVRGGVSGLPTHADVAAFLKFALHNAQHYLVFNSDCFDCEAEELIWGQAPRDDNDWESHARSGRFLKLWADLAVTCVFPSPDQDGEVSREFRFIKALRQRRYGPPDSLPDFDNELAPYWFVEWEDEWRRWLRLTNLCEHELRYWVNRF